MKFSDLNLLSIGNTIGLVGAVYAGEGKMILTLFPEHQGTIGADRFYPQDGGDELEIDTLNMAAAEWEAFVRQTDLLETEVLTKASDGTLAKIILRKSTRAIDTAVQWRCWRRDQFRCQYCWGELPLTVDHLVPWSQSGPSVEANLLSSCKKDNKIRGDMSFEEWLRHPRYMEVSKNLPSEIRARNEALVATLDKIPRMVHTRSR
jgi:hypothetical protein